MTTLTPEQELNLLRRFVSWADPVVDRYKDGQISMVIYDEIAWSDYRNGFTVDEMDFLEGLTT